MSKQKILPIAIAVASVVIIDGAQSALYVNEQGTGKRSSIRFTPLKTATTP